jgi:hypothetical protein
MKQATIARHQKKLASIEAEIARLSVYKTSSPAHVADRIETLKGDAFKELAWLQRNRAASYLTFEQWGKIIKG